jgi:hypothetical protein
VDNGGILDRVHFISQVRFPEDADFLSTIIESNPTRYTFRDFGMMNRFGNYTGLWDHDIDPDAIYIKIGQNRLPPQSSAILPHLSLFPLYSLSILSSYYECIPSRILFFSQGTHFQTTI